MEKYILKEPIEAIEFKEGMEDGWIVYFWGNMYTKSRVFNIKEEALNFVKNNEGFSLLEDEDQEYGDIEYENPQAFVYNNPSFKNGLNIVKEGDYIISDILDKNKKIIIKKDDFENKFKKIEL